MLSPADPACGFLNCAVLVRLQPGAPCLVMRLVSQFLCPRNGGEFDSRTGRHTVQAMVAARIPNPEDSVRFAGTVPGESRTGFAAKLESLRPRSTMARAPRWYRGGLGSIPSTGSGNPENAAAAV